jgi:hypothetical protein
MNPKEGKPVPPSKEALEMAQDEEVVSYNSNLLSHNDAEAEVTYRGHGATLFVLVDKETGEIFKIAGNSRYLPQDSDGVVVKFEKKLSGRIQSFDGDPLKDHPRAYENIKKSIAKYNEVISSEEQNRLN